MPLVNMKSNLSQIKRAFGSDTTTAGSTNISKVVGVDVDLNTSKLPRTAFLDLKGDTPIKYTFKTQFQNPTDITNSRLEVLWDDRKTDYYAQAKGTGRLGYRNNDVTGFDQPFVIRDIGDKWGVDRIELGDSKFTNTVEDVLNFGLKFLNSAGEAIYGRNPNEYIGSGLGSLERLGKFLGTPHGAAFLLKQKVLMRRNKQKVRTDVKYGLAGDMSVENHVIGKGDLEKRFENPRAYSIFSLGSLPGVTKINILKSDPNLLYTPYIDTIADSISAGALQAAAAVKDILQRSTYKFATKTAPDWIKKKLIGEKNVNEVTQTVDALKDAAKAVDEKRKAFNDASANFRETVSKKTALKINPNVKALSSVGVDRVNLIPYGTRDKAVTPDGKTEEEIDFIPFRFKDMGGNLIVFRAILSSITDAFTPNYADQKYIGRPDKVYVYTGTDRLISFTFDIYPKSDKELVVLWEKMNALAGLTYPTYDTSNPGMIAPFCKLTIGDMYRDTPGYLSGLTYTVQDTGTWETTFAKLPKYIQAQCTFVYIGEVLPTSDQAFYEPRWIPKKMLSTMPSNMDVLNAAGAVLGTGLDVVRGSIKASREGKELIKNMNIG